MDIGAWLQSLGLEQYETVFRANAVDAEGLPDLGEADLEKLGVLLGHRKKLLKAIAALQDKLPPRFISLWKQRILDPKPSAGS